MKNMKASIAELGNKLDQLAIQFLKMEGKGKLPAQPNHANVSAITLRSGKVLNENNDVPLPHFDLNLKRSDSNIKKEDKVHTNPFLSNASSSNNDSNNHIDNPPPPFPSRLSQPRKKLKNDEELLEVFKKVEVNLPLLTAVKSIPRYPKFLKESCTNKRRSRSQEKVTVSKIVSSLIKKNLLEIQTYLLPCLI